MKIKLVAIAAVVTLGLLLSFTHIAVAAPGAKPAPAVAQPATAAPAPAAAPVPPHPEIRQALEALRRARQRIAEAGTDFGGHRVDALRATDEAIRQLEICLRY